MISQIPSSKQIDFFTKTSGLAPYLLHQCKSFKLEHGFLFPFQLNSSRIRHFQLIYLQRPLLHPPYLSSTSSLNTPLFSSPTPISRSATPHTPMAFHCCILERLKSQPIWFAIIFAFGLLFVLKSLFRILKWLYIAFLRPAKNLKKYGSWAIVTGSTDGIGKGFAFQLARKGINLVLVGRNPDKLREVSDSIRAKHASTEIKTVVVDFAGDLDAGIQRIRDAIEGLDLGILINNVGVSYPYARFFHEVDEELLNILVKVNVEGTTKVTHAVIPVMLRRKKGAIVNIGSGSATVIPSDPLYTVYAATKAYVDQFSRSLHVEYKKLGIDVQCQVPLYVATKMAKIKRSSLLVPSTDSYAKAGLRYIGYEACCTPYWPHSLVWGIAGCIPESFIDAWRRGFCMRIRKRGLLKDSRKNE